MCSSHPVHPHLWDFSPLLSSRPLPLSPPAHLPTNRRHHLPALSLSSATTSPAQFLPRSPPPRAARGYAPGRPAHGSSSAGSSSRTPPCCPLPSPPCFLPPQASGTPPLLFSLSNTATSPAPFLPRPAVAPPPRAPRGYAPVSHASGSSSAGSSTARRRQARAPPEEALCPPRAGAGAGVEELHRRRLHLRAASFPSRGDGDDEADPAELEVLELPN
jgi:hypothetical protein